MSIVNKTMPVPIQNSTGDECPMILNIISRNPVRNGLFTLWCGLIKKMD